MTTISVAMATFNGAPFLRQQLESLVEQDLKPSELLIGDDGSTDETLDIAQTFALHAPFPVSITINERRLGYAANFLACTQRCIGDLIALCDQDDVWLPQKLSTQAASFEEDDVLLSTHNAMLIDASGTAMGLHRPTFSLRRRMTLSDTNSWAFMSGFTQVFRRELLRFNPYWARSIDLYRPDDAAGHDLWFFFLALSLGTVVSERQPLALYRQHGRNASGSKTAKAYTGLPGIEADRRSNEYARMSKVADNRATILSDISQDVAHVSYRDAASSAAVRYADAAARSTRRHQIYSSKDFRGGLKRLSNCIMNGDYAFNDAARFSTTGAARDFFSILTRRPPNPGHPS